VIAALSIGDSRDPRELKLPIYMAWEEDMNKIKETYPEGLRNVYQTASMWWAWAESEKAFFSNAIGGMLLAMCFAMCVIYIATKNWIITLFAIHCVGFICGAEMSLQVARGYEMGVAESIGTILVIGFSVDYVVHLASHYVHSSQPLRFNRTAESIGEMGISIFSGAMTTIGSAAFLYGGAMNFFQKFAFIITSTCAIALCFSMVYFIALTHAFGPEGRTGQLNLKCCKKKDKGRERKGSVTIVDVDMITPRKSKE